MGDSIPSDWKYAQVQDVISRVLDFRGRTPKKLGMEWGNGNIRALSANNVQMGKIDFDKECYLASSDLYDKWMTKGDTAKNDIVFTMEAPLGNVAIVEDDSKYILSQRVILLTAKKNAIYPFFLYHQFRGDNFQNQLFENSTGSTVVGIQQKRLLLLSVSLPPLPEQKKIATILTSVDTVIEKTQAQIDKLNDLKTGMMQELLTKGIGPDGKPHTEFKDSPVGRIPVGWECRNISKVTKEIIDYRGKSPPKSDSGVPLITAKNIRFGHLDKEPQEFIPTSKYDEWMSRGYPESGDILFTTEAPLGNATRIPKYKFAVGQRTLILRPDHEIMYSDFLLHSLLGRYLQNELGTLSTGSTVQGIKQSTLRDILLPFPTKLDEQKKIATKLNSIDKTIALLESRHSTNVMLKKALMQDLLTGKVRVTPDPE